MMAFDFIGYHRLAANGRPRALEDISLGGWNPLSVTGDREIMSLVSYHPGECHEWIECHKEVSLDPSYSLYYLKRFNTPSSCSLMTLMYTAKTLNDSLKLGIHV